MILIKTLEYSKNLELELEITEFVNKNILEIIDFFDDTLRDCCDEEEIKETFEFIIPERCFYIKDFSIPELWHDFKNIISSDVIRMGDTDLKPIYQYILYYLIEWALDFENDGICKFCKNINKKLKNKILACPDYNKIEIDENYSYAKLLLKNITTLEEYLEFLFEDWDFKKAFVDKVVTLYINNKEQYDMIFPDVNLDDYLLLMSKDLYDVYCEVNNNEEKRTEQIIINGNNNVVDNSFNKKVEEGTVDSKSWFEKYGISTIIAGILGLIGVILTIIF